MKKLLFIFSAGCVFLLNSCNGKKEGGMSETAKKNLDAMHAVSKMFESGDWSKAGDYIAADGVDHAGMNGDVKGLDSMKAEWTRMMATMSDMKSEVVKELADDEYVMSWMKQSMTAKVDMMGMKAGSRNTTDAIEVSRFKDGKAIEHWSFINWGDMMKMMPPPPPATAAMDTMKHK